MLLVFKDLLQGKLKENEKKVQQNTRGGRENIEMELYETFIGTSDQSETRNWNLKLELKLQ